MAMSVVKTIDVSAFQHVGLGNLAFVGKPLYEH